MKNPLSFEATALREFLIAHFDREELRTLCQDLGVDYDSLRGEGKAAQARELIAYLERHSRVDALVARLQLLRPAAWAQEMQEPERDSDSLITGPTLPPKNYTRLWGRDDILAEILAVLAARDQLPIVALTGLGGIGKTALAREIAERALAGREFAGVVWSSAKREELAGAEIAPLESPSLSFDFLLDEIARQLGQPDLAKLARDQKLAAVKRLLSSNRYLLVIDNLETVEDYKGLVAQLRSLLSTSRALLTSRPQLGAFAFVRSVLLQGLEPDASLDLVRQDARERGVRGVAEQTDEVLREIYTTTGGAPLALKLVVGQIAVGLPLDSALANLRGARGDIYPYLYRQSWELLTESAQMMLIYIGRTVPALASVSYQELADAEIAGSDEFERSLIQTVEMSLVYPGAEVLQEQRRYSIHPLTRHFILSDLPELWRQQGLLSDTM